MYVQREIDNNFRSVWSLVPVYINDIVCVAKSLPDLLDKLQTLFEIFLNYNISICPIKSYFNYSNMAFLGQRVNLLGWITSEQKLNAI